jgi:hypothetical protein
MPNRASVFAPIAPNLRRTRAAAAAQVDNPQPYRLLHELLKEAGLRACRVEPSRSDDSWSVSAIHSGEDGNWLTCQMIVRHHQLVEASESQDAHRNLVSHLAKTLAPRARNIT